MSKRIPKVIVIHPDRQHSLQTALALQNCGMLYRYFTTVYLKKYSISSLLAFFSPRSIRKKFLKHKLVGLDDTKIKMYCEIKMLILSFFSRFMSASAIDKWRRRIIQAFNKKCLQYCMSHQFDVLISYDTLSGDIFQKLKANGVKLILDMSAPCFKEMYANFAADVVRHPNESQVLIDYLKSEKVAFNLANCKAELKTYDYFLAASSYTKDTLIKNGVNPDKIIIAPYGLTQIDETVKTVHDTFNCVFIGSITQQKGCHYIFRLASKLPDVNFNLIGAYDNSFDDIPSNCKLLGYLSFDEIKDILKSTDLCLFLSLADGFGFAATEAMAYGIPVICSKYAGVQDLIVDNGWIVDSVDIENIAEIIKWCKANPKELHIRGERAKTVVNNVTWNDYGQVLSDFIRKI